MNALLNINVTVNAAQANAQLGALRGQVQQLQAAQNSGAAAGNKFANAFNLTNLEKFGKNLQWTGRQLVYNFTLPLGLAGAAAGKWAMENEAAMTTIEKAYSAFGGQTADTRAELDALSESFDLLSERFGVHKSEVLEIGAAWATAGAQGVALAKATRLTLETMVLGQQDSKDATQELLTVQSAYLLNTDQLREALVTLNAVQVSTAVEFGGLVDAVSRAGGIAATAGIDIQHLAAFVAALVPATGSAASAGNGLRTIISRIMAPTKQAAEEMGLFGINVNDAAWQMKNGTQRIEEMSAKFVKLSDAQQVMVASVVGSRWQINKLDVLLRDVANASDEATKGTSAYAIALDTSADKNKAAFIYAKQLSQVLSSTPKQFDILTTILQNAMSKIILPVLPAIIAILKRVAQAVQWFSDLSPEIQQLAIGFLFLLAVIGPITQMLGAFVTLFTTVGRATKWMIAVLIDLGKVFVAILTPAIKIVGAAFSWLWSGIVSGAGLAAKAIGYAFSSTMLVLRGIGQLIYAAVIVVVEGLISVLPALLSGISFLFSKLLASPIMNTILFMLDFITTAFWRGLVWITTAIPALFSGIASSIGGFVTAVASGLEAVASTVVIWVASTGAAVITAMSEGLMAAGAFITSFITWISSALPAAMGRLVRTIPLFFSVLGDVILAFSTWISTAVPAAFAAAGEGIMAVIVWIQTAIPAAFAAIKEAILVASVAVDEVLTSAFAFMGQAVMAVMGFLTTAIPAAWAAIGEASTAVIVWMQTAIPAAWAFMGELMTTITTAIWTAIPAIWSAGIAVLEAIQTGFEAFMAMSMTVIAELLANPWALAIAAAVAGLAVLVAVFHDNIAALINWIIDAFNQLPQAIVDVFKTVVKVIESIMEKVKEALSHLNPFARHSPSLVDNVTAGMATILDEYKTLQKIPGIIKSAVAAQKQFDAAVLASANALDKAEFDMEKMQIAAVAGPQSVPAIDAMVSSILQMRDALASVNVELQNQQRLVDDMQRQIDADMKPYNDAIYANEEAQKKLRLEIMKMEDAGQTIDDIKDKMAKLAGEIESLRGVREDLRLAGAGSDVLKSYDDQITALQKQHDALEGVQDPIQKLQDELDKLQRKGEELNLEKDLKFDPQLKALDEQKDKLSQLQDAYDGIKSTLSDMEQALSGWAQKATSAAAATKSAADSMNADQFNAAAGANFPDVTGSTVPGLGREGGLPQIEDFNAQLQQELDDALNNMGSFDMFKPLREQWDKFWAWMSEHVGPKVGDVMDKIKGGFGGIDIGASFSGLWDSFKNGLSEIDKFIQNSPLADFWKGIKDAVVTVAEVVAVAFGGLKEVFGWLQGWAADAGRSIGDELKNWAPMFGKASEAIGHILNILGIVFQNIRQAVEIVLIAIIAAWQVAWPLLKNILEPILNTIVGLIRAGLEIIRGVISFILDIINGDWSAAWDDILTIVSGVWDAIYEVIKAPVDLIVGVVRGLVEGIVRLFEWVYDQLVGHSIIPDLVHAIVDLFNWMIDPIKLAFQLIWAGIQWAWENVGQPIFDGIKWVIENILIPAFQLAWDTIKYIWDALMTDIKLLWDHILSPIFDGIKWMIENVVIPAFQLAWKIVSYVWDALMTDIKLAWDKILSPIFDGIKWAIENIVIPAFNLAKDVAGAAFNALGAGIQFVWDHVINPIFEGLKTAIGFVADKFVWLRDNVVQPVWDAIGMIIAAGWNGVKTVLETGLNYLVNAFNFLARGVNGITEFLHLGSPLPELGQVSLGGDVAPPSHGPAGQFASGGVMPFGVPFVANMPTAIVGEGNSSYNEYVIPTDPRYRKRALDLYASLGTQLLDAGDIIGDIPIVGSVASWISDFYNNVNSGIHSINSIGVDFIKAAGSFVKDKVIDWGKDKIGSAIGGFADAVKSAAADAVDPLGIRHIFGESGGIFTGAMAHANYIPGLGGGGVVLPSPGGTVVRLAERGQAETVLPYDATQTQGKTENNFYGDFIFPNVKDGKDAKTFFDNLKKVS